MVESLFDTLPNNNERILYIGEVNLFLTTVRKYCDENDSGVPEGVGIHPRSKTIQELRDSYDSGRFYDIDFLSSDIGKFDYVLGTGLSMPEDALSTERKEKYREKFNSTVRSYNNVSSLFFEQAVRHLRQGGRTSFSLPMTFETSESDRQLRKWITDNYHVTSIEEFKDEDEPESVGNRLLVTVANEEPGVTEVPAGEVKLPKDGDNWAPAIKGVSSPGSSDTVLEDICRQIAIGVSTGADSVFILDEDELPPQLEDLSHPIVGGKQLSAYDDVKTSQRVICPYTESGEMMSERELGESFLTWAEMNRSTLEDRSTIHGGKGSWYSWSQQPPLDDIFEPKLMTRDFADEIKFWMDESGEYIPRKTVFYMVPEPEVSLRELQRYLNTEEVREWLEAITLDGTGRGHRLKVRDLRKLPVPSSL
jgi:hypothetical protein